MKLTKIMAGIAASALATTALAAVASAYDIDGGIYGLTNKTEIRVADNGQQLLGLSSDNTGYDVYGDTMDIFGEGPEDNENEDSCKLVLEQNYDLWSKVDKVSVTFTLDASASDKAYAEENPDDLDYTGFFCQGFIQLGGATNWKWIDSGASPELVAIKNTAGELIDNSDEDHVFTLGQTYVLEMYPSAAIESSGVTGTSAGVLKMGLAIGNNGMQWRDDEALYFDITFEDLDIEGDQETIAKYTAVGNELRGISNEPTVDDPTTDDPTTDDPTTDEPTTDEPTTDTPVVDEPTTDAPTTDAPTTDAPTTGDTTKPNSNTGVESLAVVAGVAVLATGAIVVSKKRK